MEQSGVTPDRGPPRTVVLLGLFPLRFQAGFAMASSLLGVVIITVLLLVLIGVVGQILFGNDQG